MYVFRKKGLLGVLSLLLALVFMTLSLPLGSQAKTTYKTSYSSMRYEYGEDLYDKYPDVPYVAWLLDFASDQIHGYGNYQETKGKGNGYELDVVCSTLIYYALYSTGYNVPQYINISRDDDIKSAKSRIQNVRANFCAETMYSKRLMTKAGFQAIPITDSTKIRDLKVGDIIWIFTKKLAERPDDDESAYSEKKKEGLYYHAEVVVEVKGSSFVTVGAHGREGCKDKYPGDNPAVDKLDEVGLKRYKNLHYDGKKSLPRYTMIYRPTASMPRGETRPYQPALIQKSRDVKYKITGQGEVTIQNEPALISDTAIIGTRVSVKAQPDEGYVLKSLKIRNNQDGTYLTLSKNGTFKMPALKWGKSVTIKAVFEKADDGTETGRSGWDSSAAGKSYYLDGKKVKGFATIKDKVYYFDKKGILQTGWQTIDGKKYCFTKAGVMRTGWQTMSGDTYYFDETGAMQTGFLHHDGNTYYLGKNGVMRTGWKTIGGSRYYFSNAEGREGTMLVGIRRLGKYFYYFGEDGKQQTGLLDLIDGTFYFKPDTTPAGKMQTGWKKIGSGRYYFSENGYALTGWQTIGKKTYYLSDKGRARTGWRTIDGERYYFNAKGVLQTGWQTIEDKTYYLGNRGVMQKGLAKIEGDHYFFGEDGVMITSSWQDVGEDRYYFGKKGKAFTGTRKVDGKTYTFGEDGKLQASQEAPEPSKEE